MATDTLPRTRMYVTHLLLRTVDGRQVTGEYRTFCHVDAEHAKQAAIAYHKLVYGQREPVVCAYAEEV